MKALILMLSLVITSGAWASLVEIVQDPRIANLDRSILVSRADIIPREGKRDVNFWGEYGELELQVTYSDYSENETKIAPLVKVFGTFGYEREFQITESDLAVLFKAYFKFSLHGCSMSLDPGTSQMPIGIRIYLDCNAKNQ
jgi:hypothetical protein